MLFPQTLITMIYNDISGLHMCFSEWRTFCQDAWKARYKYTQIDKDEDLVDMYSIQTYQVWRLRPFQRQLLFILMIY